MQVAYLNFNSAQVRMSVFIQTTNILKKQKWIKIASNLITLQRLHGLKKMQLFS